MSQITKLAIGSLIVGVVVLGVKYVAYLMTGSVALLSDALESIVNVATAIAALIAVQYASRPADANHPYGHHKAEFFSAVLEGVLIVIAAIVIAREAWDAIAHPRSLDAPLAGLAVNLGANVINAGWCWILITRGRRLRSPALVADGKHLLSDVVSSIGVTGGVLVAILTGWPLLDPIMALLVAVNILWTGSKVVRQSLSSLMDEALPEETLKTIRRVIAENASGAVQAHDLRTRHAGQVVFIDFHLIVPGEMSVTDSHVLCDRVEHALREAIPGSQITIHVEPEHKAKAQAIEID